MTSRSVDDREPPRRSFRDAVRGQSEVLGVVLLLGITITGATAVVALGSTTLSDSQQRADVGKAEHAMTQLDSQASLVGHGEADSRHVAVPTEREATTRIDSEGGWMRLEIRNETSDAVEEEVMNETLGTVAYENGDTTIAYQGGGVWKQSGGGSTMVSPPEFHYRASAGSDYPTLTLPLIVVEGSGSFDGDLTIERGETVQHYPNGSLPNPLTEGRVAVVVRSEYYRAWAEFFEERTGGQTTIDHENETVTLELVSPVAKEAVTSAISVSSSDGDLHLRGTGSEGAHVDSYSSSDGGYAEAPSSNGTIETSGVVRIQNHVTVEGDVRANDVRLENHANVTGTVYYGESIDPDDWEPSEEIDPVEGIDSIDLLVESTVSDLEEENDNDGTDAISDDQLDMGAEGERTLGSGEYYLDDLELGTNDNLTLDTSSGDITIGVRDTIHLDADSNVTVEGDGRVNVFFTGEQTVGGSGQPNMVMDDASVYADNDTAARFWIYGPSDVEMEFQEGARFVGVVYAPAGGGGTGVVEINNHAQVLGAVAGNEVDVAPNGELHYDTALTNARPLEGTEDTSIVTYLHISHTEVTFSDD